MPDFAAMRLPGLRVAAALLVGLIALCLYLATGPGVKTASAYFDNGNSLSLDPWINDAGARRVNKESAF